MPYEYICAMFGWMSLAADCASRLNFSTNSASEPYSFSITFTATARSSILSRPI